MCEKMANEKRLIDADAFLEHWNKEYRHQYANDMFKVAIANFPTVDAVEVVHGRWIFRKNWDYFVCSKCSCESSNYSNYCPNCGAKMDGDGNGTTQD